MRHGSTLDHMSTQTQEGRVPELTLGWRLKMSLGDMSRAEMAEALEVDPGTISRWCADKGTAPKRAFVLQWAMLTGVNPVWLETGHMPANPTPPNGGGNRQTEAMRRLTESKRTGTRQDAPKRR